MKAEEQELKKLQKSGKSKKAKSDTLSAKVSKANMKNLKDHIYIEAAFFERCRMEFINEENAKYTFNNIDKPNFPPGYVGYKITDGEYLNMSATLKDNINEYGLLLKNTYLEKVRIF